MKPLKSTKRRAVASLGKPGRGTGHTVRRTGIITSSSGRALPSLASRPISRTRNRQENKTAVSRRERPQIDVRYQAAVKNFETGVRAFHKQNYGKAAEIFAKLLESEARDVAERANVHLRLCRQRAGRAAPPPKSADEYYTLGVACLNAREFGLAVEHLSKADKLKPHQDHVHYALAVSHALGGNPDAAFAHLEAAFALRPENRIHARRDEDFNGLADDPRFRRLLYVSGA